LADIKVVVRNLKGGWEILIINGWLAVADVLSVTLAVKLKVPDIVGVPEMTPDGARFIPGGGLPLIMLQVKGGLSPVAVRAA
jgi:hypothetical protein